MKALKDVFSVIISLAVIISLLVVFLFLLSWKLLVLVSLPGTKTINYHAVMPEITLKYQQALFSLFSPVDWTALLTASPYFSIFFKITGKLIRSWTIEPLVHFGHLALD